MHFLLDNDLVLIHVRELSSALVVCMIALGFNFLIGLGILVI
uniref:Uncharacterized protein n=1 Tax=Arundo donax TaxID=35708 RepID=A0A0A8ZFL6_ARUDO